MPIIHISRVLVLYCPSPPHPARHTESPQEKQKDNRFCRPKRDSWKTCRRGFVCGLLPRSLLFEVRLGCEFAGQETMVPAQIETSA